MKSVLKKSLPVVLLFIAAAAHAQVIALTKNTEGTSLPSAKHEQRIHNRRAVLEQAETDLEKAWADTKHTAARLGLDVGVDVSYLAQRGAPSGKQTAIQGVYYPYS